MPSSPLATSFNPALRPQAGDDALFQGGGSKRSNSGQPDFSSILGNAKQKADETPEQFARRTAESFVAIGLVQPILKKLRETNHAAPPFAPTDGEKQFRSLADAELAQRIVHSTNFPLVDRIAQQLTEKARSRAGGKDAPGPSSSSSLPAIPWSHT